MGEWKKKLGESPIQIIDGDRGKNYPSQNDFLLEGYCLFLSTKNVRESGFDFSDCQFVSKDRDEAMRKGKLQRLDTVLTTRGTVGNVAFYGPNVPFENIRINSGMVILRPDQRYIDPRYCFYVFRDLQRDFSTYSTGSAQPQLPIRDLSQMEVSLPDLPEQRAIASVLSSLDDKIDLLHRQNRTLEKMAETLFRQWFVPARRNPPVADEGGEEAEEGWEERELGELLEETIGGEWGEDEPIDDHEAVYCLRGVDIQKIKENGFSGSVPIRFVRSDRINKRLLSESEILLAASGVGPIGRTLSIHRDLISSYSFPLIYSNFCKRLRAKSKFEAFFWEYLLFQMYKEGEMDQFHTGTSIPNFDMKGLLNLRVRIPPEKKRLEFGKHLDMWYQKKFSGQIRTLTQMRDTLLPKLMSGEIRVKSEQ